jgi:hypothetical protein
MERRIMLSRGRLFDVDISSLETIEVGTADNAV